MKAAIGTARTEAGFIPYRASDGKIGTAKLPNTNEDKRISFKISDIIPKGATAIAIFHTHPNSASATPSTGDPPSDRTETGVRPAILAIFGFDSSGYRSGND